MLNKFQEIELLIGRAGEHLEWLRKYVVNQDPISQYVRRWV